MEAGERGNHGVSKSMIGNMQKTDNGMKNHIYILDTYLLENTGTFDKWYRKMPPERREKIDSFHFLKDRRLSLGAGILLYKCLLREGITDGKLSFAENGKPFLADRRDIHFNLSHSENMAVCAVSDRPVGVDIEACRHFENDLADFAFHKSEIDYIRRKENDADMAFTRLWTIKESVMKYFGTGLSLEPKEIYVDMRGGISAFCERYHCGNIYFAGYDVKGYAVTVCSGYKDFSGRPEWVTP